jgi:hypothetical protein
MFENCFQQILKKKTRWVPELQKNQPRMGKQSSQMGAKIEKNGPGGTPKEEQNTTLACLSY